MYLLTHTIKNLKRNAQKNSILFLITVFILTICSLALLVNETASALIVEYQERFGATVSILPNAQRVLENANIQGDEAIQAPSISSEDYQSFATSPYLKETMFTSSLYVYAPQYKAFGATSAAMNTKEMEEQILAQEKEKENIRLLAYSNRDLMSEFQKHERYINDGSIFQNELECIISSQFAHLNDLSVGDKLELPLEKEKSFELTISGIFTDTTPEQKDDTMRHQKTNRRNEILMGYDTFQAYMVLNSSNISNIQLSAQYYLNDPDDVEAFGKECYEKGLSTQYDVLADKSGYEETVEPIMALEGITQNFLCIVFFGGTVLMSFLAMFMIRERKYEMGILRAIGLGKCKVILLYVLECMFMNLIALAFSLILASALVQPISDSMLQSQIETIEAKYSNGSFGENIQELSKEESRVLREMPIQMDMDALFHIILATICFSICCSTVGIAYLIRLQPMKILSHRE